MNQSSYSIKILRMLLGTAILLASCQTTSSPEGHHGSHAGHDMGRREKATSHSKPTHFSEETTDLPEAKPLETVELKDGDRYILIASPVKQKVAGQWIRRLAYNGSVPGPIIKVKQGSTVYVTLKNQMDSDTTLHPHGLRLDDKYDGVVGYGRPPVAPGKSFEYVLKFPDAGIFWYHPHVREDYTQDAGLYGNFLVVPKSDQFYNPVHREIALMLDDVTVKNAAPYLRERVTHTLMGHFGDVMLINGQDDFQLNATEGEVVRFFLTNVSNTRVLAFAMPGIRLKLIGSDNGLYEKATWTEKVIIGPSERYIVEAKLSGGPTVSILNDKPSGAVKMGQINITKGRLENLAAKHESITTSSLAYNQFRAIRNKRSLPVSKTLVMTLTMDHSSLPMDMGHHGHDHSSASTEKSTSERNIEWDDQMAEMNAKSNDSNVVWKLVDKETGKENMMIDWIFKKGDYVKIRLINDPKSMHPMQHPIHFHGQRFIVDSINGNRSDNLVWKDSTLVAAGETVDIILEASNPGSWMAHCHIAEHLGAGMMIGFQVR